MIEFAIEEGFVLLRKGRQKLGGLSKDWGSALSSDVAGLL